MTDFFSQQQNLDEKSTQAMPVQAPLQPILKTTRQIPQIATQRLSLVQVRCQDDRTINYGRISAFR